jgi:hypothetical protein
MARRTRTYVAFDADTDIRMYYLMKAWKANDGIDFDFNNAHDLTTIREDSGEDAIKRSLRERMNNSKIFILLVGENTMHLRKYVPYEIEIAQKANLPFIVVNLNGKRQIDRARCPRSVERALAIHVPFEIKPIQFALDNWPASHAAQLSAGKSGPFHYDDDTYTRYGLN